MTLTVRFSLGRSPGITVADSVAEELDVKGGTTVAVERPLDHGVGAVVDGGGDDREVLPQIGAAVSIIAIVQSNIGAGTQIIVFSSCVQIYPEFAVVIYLVLADQIAVIGKRNRTTARIVDDHQA